MDPDEPLGQFLARLFEMSSGDPSAQISMYEIGAELGLEKELATRTAEELIGSGMVEIRTLSGGIGITEAGIAEIEKNNTGTSDPSAILNDDPIINQHVRPALEALIEEVGQACEKWSLDAADVEELKADLRTSTAQLASPKPKTAILRETLHSLAGVLARVPAEDLLQRLRKMLGG